MTTAIKETFPPEVIKFRPGKVANGRALALAYVDARDAMDMLDSHSQVWSDTYRIVGDNIVECSLTVDGVTHTDVGYPNGATDEEPLKSAYSDALKRAAVKFGVGRELYDMPQFWLPLDEHKRFVRIPVYRDGQWVEPGESQQQAAAKSATPRAASEAKRKAVFARATEKGLTGKQWQAFVAMAAQVTTLRNMSDAVADRLLAAMDNDDLVATAKDVQDG